MDLQTAIERAKSALEERIARLNMHTGSVELNSQLRLDTQALQALRETLLGMDLAKQPDSAPTGEGREE